MKHFVPGRRSISFLFVLLSILLIVCSAAQAQGVKERMLARLPQIDSMKASGMLGENNRGYLEFVGKERQNENIVSAENEDRKNVYIAIAAKQGTSPELVGRRRALQIAENAVPGSWLQAEDGSWYRK